MKDHPLNSDDDRAEPFPRPGTIPDDFLWDPEEQCWYPPGAPTEYEANAWRRELERIREEYDEDERFSGLISRDQLLAAGALDCPPEMRKSLGARPKRDGQRDLFSDLP